MHSFPCHSSSYYHSFVLLKEDFKEVTENSVAFGKVSSTGDIKYNAIHKTSNTIILFYSPKFYSKYHLKIGVIRLGNHSSTMLFLVEL